MSMALPIIRLGFHQLIGNHQSRLHLALRHLLIEFGINLYIPNNCIQKLASMDILQKYEKPYTAKRLNNWELPRWHPPWPRKLKCCAKVIADNNGYLFPGVKRDNNPWGNFRSTYMLPERLTRRFADEYHECLINRQKWRHFPQKTSNKICPEATKTSEATTTKTSCPTKCETAEYCLGFLPDTEKFINKCEKPKKSLDLEYIPGDFTPAEQQHPSRQLLLEQKYERGENTDADLSIENLHLNDHRCKLPSSSNFTQPMLDLPLALPPPKVLTPPISPPPPSLTVPNKSDYNDKRKTAFTVQTPLTENPNECYPLPFISTYDNFDLAKRMHRDNLQHQPLPDSIPDSGYCQFQLTGKGSDKVLSSEKIYATGMGVKSQNMGPTQCTKLKVYRPKTCAKTRSEICDNNSLCRPSSSGLPSKKVGAMDLAICWDFAPAIKSNESAPTHNIDGSNDSAGPAVFSYVKTPRDNDNKNIPTGRSAGIFRNTLCETDFFDKDTLRRNTDISGRPVQHNKLAYDCRITDPPRARTENASRNYNSTCLPNEYKHSQRHHSSPDLLSQQEIKSLRKQYLGTQNSAVMGCKRANPSFLRSARARVCQKVSPAALNSCPRSENIAYIPTCKAAAFRVGIPRYNAAGNLINPSRRCSAQSTSCCHSNRVLVIPRPRSPYLKKNYNVETLVPPFRSYAGGSCQGGYPDHWRLSSVYQHAFKPMEQRKRSLLQTVYK